MAEQMHAHPQGIVDVFVAVHVDELGAVSAYESERHAGLPP